MSQGGRLNCDPFKIIPETLNYVLYTKEKFLVNISATDKYLINI